MAPLRVAVGAFMQETNDFSPLLTVRDTFEGPLGWGVMRGQEMLTNSPALPSAELKAFIADLQLWPAPVDILPLASLGAMSQGRMTGDTHVWARGLILDPLRQAAAEAPLSGVLLALHGAMVAEGEEDPEGALLSSVRKIVGPDVPIVATLDLHVHLTRRMSEAADALLIYHCIPHVDMVETGQRAVRTLRSIILGGAQPVTFFAKLPLHLPVERVNTEASAADVAAGKYAEFPTLVSRRMMALEQEPWCLGAGLGTTQPWLNVHDLGATFLVVADAAVSGATSRARLVVSELASSLWEAREQYMPAGDSLLSVEAAVSQAHEHACSSERKGVVAIGDGADATTSGSPGDSTWLLRELLKYQWPCQEAPPPASDNGTPAGVTTHTTPRHALITLVSARLADLAQGAGVGGRLSLPVGGELDTRYSEPWPITARVERLFDGSYTVKHGHCAGMHFELQLCACLKLVTDGDDTEGGSERDTGVRMVVTTGSGAHFATELFALAGYDAYEAGVVICKSPAGFRATYGARAGMMVSADAKGCAPAKFWLPEYRDSFPTETSALFPWDESASYTAESGGGSGGSSSIEVFESALAAAVVEVASARL